MEMHPLARALGFGSALFLAAPAAANPITALFQDDGRCDAVGDTRLEEELGRGAGDPLHGPVTFPADEALRIQVLPYSGLRACGQAAPGIEVRLTNLTPSALTDLFFVAAPGISVLNADGTVFGNDAFRIDTKGFNPSLSELGAADGVLAPGETWLFNVLSPTYYSIASATSGRVGGNTFGIGGADATSYLGYPDFSILTIAVAEPTLLWLAAGLAGAIWTREGRAAGRR
jgi:hypothetical protein